MPTLWNSPTVATPASNYTQCAIVQASERNLYTAGQIGDMPDGTMANSPLTKSSLDEVGMV